LAATGAGVGAGAGPAQAAQAAQAGGRVQAVQVAGRAQGGRAALGSSAAGVAASAGGYGEFKHPTVIDARYFPLRPGTQFIYDGTVTDAEGSHQHRVVFTVTDIVKVVGGVTSRVIWDQDINNGELTEAELAFFAQDEQGNVWTMGEYPEEYEAGKFTGAPSTWISGAAKAQAGVLVPGHPRVGTPQFVQGRAPAIQFFDVGKVIRSGVRICVPAGCFSGVVVIDEFSPTAPESGHQQKYYAPNTGLVNIDASSGGSREVLRLTTVCTLDRKTLAAADAQTLRLDTRAYRFAADVYRGTPPAHRER
jgi:hypothetical protein